MRRITRKFHLWIGLITSVFLLMEAITGLLLTEPWLIGQSEHREIQNFEQTSNLDRFSNDRFEGNSDQSDQLAEGVPTQPGNFPRDRNFRDNDRENGSVQGFIRGLHEGRIGNTDIKWAIDIAAISIIFLTLTGIYLSIKILIAENKRSKRLDLKTSALEGGDEG